MPAGSGISAGALTAKVDQFLGARGFKAETPGGGSAPTTPVSPSSNAPLDFVCEEDVRKALQAGTTLLVSERAIITPSARELGEARRIFAVAPWKG